MSFHGAALAVYAGLPGWGQTVVTVLLTALVVLVGVRIVQALLMAAVRRSPRVDATLAGFVKNIVGAVGWVVVALAVLGAAGVDATALVASLAIGGLILGFALKDAIGNLAAGVMLLLYRPLGIGDAVDIGGHGGTVKDIGIALTRMETWDGRYLTLPNGLILNEPILNMTRTERRRIELDVGVAYDDDLDTAVRAVLEAAHKDARVHADPAPQVLFTALADSSVNLQLRCWVAGKDFLVAKSDLTAEVKRAVEAAGCSIPFPQRDVHLFGQGDGNGNGNGNGASGPGGASRPAGPSAAPATPS